LLGSGAFRLNATVPAIEWQGQHPGNGGPLSIAVGPSMCMIVWFKPFSASTERSSPLRGASTTPRRQRNSVQNSQPWTRP